MSFYSRCSYICKESNNTKVTPVTMSTSQLVVKQGALNVGENSCKQNCIPVRTNQSSDRLYASGRNIQMSKHLGRPGGGVTEPVNGGVDIKHNSYNRRLRRLQAKVLSNT